MAFEVEMTGIEGLVLIKPFLSKDDRGYYKKVFEREAFDIKGLATQYFEFSYIQSKRGAVRGLHYQDKHSQGKLVHVLKCMKEMESSEAVSNYANFYKTSKLAAHYYCKLKASQYGIDFLWPRLTNTYGAGELSGRLISSVIQQLLRGESPALTEGTQLYNFVYITDAVAAYRLIGEKGNAFQEYVLGGNEIRPLKDFLMKVGEIVNPHVELGFGKHSFNGTYLTEDELISEELFDGIGFSPAVAFDEGIKMTADWLRKQGKV